MKTARHLLTFLAINLVATASVCNAAAVTVANFSFETPNVADGSFSTRPTLASQGGVGWTFINSSGIEDSNDAAFAGTTGNTVALPGSGDGFQYAFLGGTNAPFAAIHQDIGLLLANTTYTLTIAAGKRLNQVNGNLTFELINGSDNTGAVLVTKTLLAADLTSGTFVDHSISFTSTAVVSGDLTILIRNSVALSPNAFDNVRLDASSIPEPSTYAVLLGGLVLACVVVHRRRWAAR